MKVDRLHGHAGFALRPRLQRRPAVDSAKMNGVHVNRGCGWQLVAVALAAWAVGCGGEPTPPADAGAGDAAAADAVTDVAAARPVSLTVDPLPVLLVGAHAQLLAFVNFNDGTSARADDRVLWRSSAPDVATIDAHGLATVVRPGMTEISAQLDDLVGTTLLRAVTPATKGVAISPQASTLVVGATQSFTASLLFSDGSAVNFTPTAAWTSSQPEIATVSNAQGSQGVVTAHAIGQTAIGFTLFGFSATAMVTVTAASEIDAGSADVSPDLPAPQPWSIAVTPQHSTVVLRSTRQFRATLFFTDATSREVGDQVIWRSSAPAVATIDAHGLATAVSPGATEISARLGDLVGIAQFQSATPALNGVAVSPTGATLAVGATQPFTARMVFSNGDTRDITQEVPWTSSHPEIASVSNAQGSQGVVTAHVVGQTAIGFTLFGFSATAMVTVRAAP